MSYLSKFDIRKMKNDADHLLLSSHAVTVTLQWYLRNEGGTYDSIYRQNDGGSDVVKQLKGVKAEKVVIRPTDLQKFDFGIVKAGDVIYRFQRDFDFSDKHDLIILCDDIKYYPVVFDPAQEELLQVAIGNCQLYQSIFTSRVKEERRHAL